MRKEEEVTPCVGSLLFYVIVYENFIFVLCKVEIYFVQRKASINFTNLWYSYKCGQRLG